MATPKHVITLADVARVAGVSTSTASRVLNGSDKVVSDDLQLRIRAVADSLGYVSNRAAQALRGRRTAVFMLVRDPRTAPIAAQAAGMEAAARAQGVLASVVVAGSNPAVTASAIRTLRGFRPKGLIINGATTDEAGVAQQLSAFAAEGGRVVTVGDSDSGFPAVRFHDRESGCLVADHVMGLGRRRVVALSGPHDSLKTRIAGLISRLKRVASGLSVEVIDLAAVSREAGREAARRISARSDRPDMVYVPNDIMAVGLLDGFRELGVRVPQDVAVASNDDIPVAKDLTPSLTTVRLDFEAAGRAALTMVLSSDLVGDTHLPGELIVRASTVAESR